MERLQRSFTKLTSKGPGDNAKVALILKDYDDAEKFLGKIIDSTKTLRDSWVSAATSQYTLVKEYAELYDPPVGQAEGVHRPTQPTADLQINRTFALREAYDQLKDEILQEVASIDLQVIQPATSAREYMQPIRKTIKKREAKRVDYERSQEKVMKFQKKPNRTPKDEAALEKAEYDMNLMSEEFQIADEHLRQTLPPLVETVFTLVPFLLASLADIENRLLGIYYTVLHGYCQEHGFPSPPPPMEDVISTWSSQFKPVQSQIESMAIIARGKAVRMPMTISDDALNRNNTPRTGIKRITSGFKSSPKENQEPERPQRVVNRIPSHASMASTARSDASPQLSRQSTHTSTGLGLPTDFTTATKLGQSPGSAALAPNYTPSRERSDYFGHESQVAPSVASSTASSPMLNGSAAAAAAVKKKKPPPPPPVKRIQAPAEYVIAEHDYPGGQEGDLVFRGGDRIKIVKKTDTMEDWWMGELAGVQGHFPANYCRPA